MFGVPLGAALTDVVVIDLINGQGRWGMVKYCRRLLAQCWLRHRKAFRPPLPPAVPSDKILVTWRSSSSRISELVMPVVQALEPERCIVLYEKDDVVAHIPRGADCLKYTSVVPHEPDIWAPEFRRCWPTWKAALKAVCRQFGLPIGVYQRLALELVQASQFFVGCRQFLQAIRPAAILTEYDRGSRWACLVLAARSLAIPTFTLQHGVLNDNAIGYVPVLADRMFCWGELARAEFVRGGVSLDRLLIGGCPRLERSLTVNTREARLKLGLDPATPVVMLATAPYAESERTHLVEIFATCMDRLADVAGVVRLHPSEDLETYENLARRHAQLHFFDNRDSTLDEALAAADVIVVHNSGIGSDAIVKGRLTIVVDLPSVPLGHGTDLVEHAHCPCVQTAEELLTAVRSLLFDGTAQERHRSTADCFVGRFCAYFGHESARKIADTVLESIHSGTPASSGASR